MAALVPSLLSLIHIYRIGEAIQDTHAQLMILDPMQAYLGEKVDMNRANEVRTVMKGLTKVCLLYTSRCV